MSCYWKLALEELRMSYHWRWRQGRELEGNCRLSHWRWELERGPTESCMSFHWKRERTGSRTSPEQELELGASCMSSHWTLAQGPEQEENCSYSPREQRLHCRSCWPEPPGNRKKK